VSLCLPTVPTVLSAHERAAFTAGLTACACPGCADGWPHPACAACGRRAAVVLGDRDHLMSLCRRCEAVVLEVRAAAGRNGAKQEPLTYRRGTPPPPRAVQPVSSRAQGTRKTPQRKRAVA